ncbi:MAG: 2-oxoacid:acceptor oxidoreductase family protein, partial [Clostridia bacterium]
MSGILLAGFGGQGILFAGKQLVTAGMKIGKQVSWLPSYGPEMRGGTCNCSVNIDDEPIGSPLVTSPDILIAMNKPSFDKFINKVKKGGYVIADSSLIDSVTDRTDVTIVFVPATDLAEKNELKGLANVIMLGALIKSCKTFDYDYFASSMKAASPKSKPQLGELNAKALEI